MNLILICRFVVLFTRFLLFVRFLIMSNRSTNMHRVNAIRSAKTAAMIDFLIALETGDGDFGGFRGFNINERLAINQLNSYRANKILNFFDKSISKKHLAVFSKSADYTYRLTTRDITDFLIKNDKQLRFYLDFYIQSYVNDVLSKFNDEIN